MPRFQVYAYVLTGILVVWAAVGGFVYSMSAGMRVSEDFKDIPVRAADWVGTDGEFDRQTYDALPTCSLLTRDYVDRLGDKVNLLIVYGRDLGEFHQPEICMQGLGWKRTGGGTVWLQPKGGTRRQATVVTMTNDYQDQVMIYWFHMGGEVSPVMVKQSALWPALLGQGLQPSAMVKFTAPVATDEESARQCAIRLAELLTQPIINVVARPAKYVPVRQARR